MEKIVNDVSKVINKMISIQKPTGMFIAKVYGSKWEIIDGRDTVYGPNGPIGKFGLDNLRTMKIRGSRYDKLMEEINDTVHKGKFKMVYDPSSTSSSRVLICVENEYYGNLLLLNRFNTFCIETNKLTTIEKFILLKDCDVVERGPLLMKIGE